MYEIPAFFGAGWRCTLTVRAERVPRWGRIRDFMLKFLKNNSYDIVKLFINQIGISVFALFLYFALSSVFNDDTEKRLLFMVLISVFSTVFYLSLIYCTSWDYGARDKVRVDGGRMTPVRGNGFFLALAANSLTFLLALVSVIISLVWMVQGGSTTPVVYTVFNFPLRLITAMYNGMLQGMFAAFVNDNATYFFLQSIGYFVFPVLPCLISLAGYRLGLADHHLFGTGKKPSQPTDRR